MSVNPIPRGGLRHPTEMSGLTSPRESGSIQNQWKTALQAIERAHASANSTALLARQGNNRAQFPNASVFYPFKVYQLPPSLRINPSATDWLKVRVRTGHVLVGAIINTTGCDGAPIAEIETYLDQTAYVDIPVPASTSLFYIWVKYTSSTAQIYFGTSTGSCFIQNNTGAATPTSVSDWPTFPNTDSSHIVIAICDSMVNASQQRLSITQMVRSDIYGAGGGNGVTATPFRVYQTYGDYIVGCDISQTNTANNLNLKQIAKPYSLRNTISTQFILGTQVNFAYPRTNYTGNNTTNGPNTEWYGIYRQANVAIAPNTFIYENQTVIPTIISKVNSNQSNILTCDIVYAISNVATNVVSEAADNLSPIGTDITWLDINADGKAWARLVNQNS